MTTIFLTRAKIYSSRCFFWLRPHLLDGPLDMPCLPDRPTISYLAADRQTKSPCRSCRSIRHTAYFLSSHATHDFSRILFINAFNLSVFHLIISNTALCPWVVSVSPHTYQLHRIKLSGLLLLLSCIDTVQYLQPVSSPRHVSCRVSSFYQGDASKWVSETQLPHNCSLFSWVLNSFTENSCHSIYFLQKAVLSCLRRLFKYRRRNFS